MSDFAFTFFHTFRLLFGLWWLWLIVFGCAIIVMGIASLRRGGCGVAILGLLVTGFGLGWLVLVPTDWLLLNLPPKRESSTYYPPDGGMPTATKFEWDLITPFYELVNAIIPYIQHYAFYLCIGWLVILGLSLISAVLQQEC